MARQNRPPAGPGAAQGTFPRVAAGTSSARRPPRPKGPPCGRSCATKSGRSCSTKSGRSCSTKKKSSGSASRRCARPGKVWTVAGPPGVEGQGTTLFRWRDERGVVRQLTERVVGEAAKIFQAELEERLREDLSGGADPLRFDATKRRLAEIPAGERRKMREAIRERTRAIRAGWTFETWDARIRQLYDDGRSVLALVAKLDAEEAHGDAEEKRRDAEEKRRDAEETGGEGTRAAA